MEDLRLETVETREVSAVFGHIDVDNEIHIEFGGDTVYLPVPLLKILFENKEQLAERYGV